MALSKLSVEKIAVFVFGVVFLTAILVLVVLIPMPTVSQFFAFRLTMALCAAGIGALLPGFLKLEVPLPMRGGIRAGGALALFASVWFVNPAALGIEVQPPKEDARVLVDRFLGLTDAGDHAAAYTLFASRAKERMREDAYVSMGKQTRDPLGGVGQRLLASVDMPGEGQGVHEPLVLHTYQSRFKDAKDTWVEVVSTVPEKGAWRIGGYRIARCELPFCQPLAALAQ